jgi:F-type H+-transporting ATPase subunit b
MLLELNPLITPNVGLIFWTTIIFILLVVVLGKFVWPSITKALETRERSIEEALKAAEAARMAKADLENEIEKIRQEGRVEREQMMKDTRVVASKMEEDARERATQEYNRILEDAKREIDSQKQNAMADVRNQVAKLSLQIAEKLVKDQLSNDSAQKQLVETYLNEIKVN